MSQTCIDNGRLAEVRPIKPANKMLQASRGTGSDSTHDAAKQLVELGLL